MSPEPTLPLQDFKWAHHAISQDYPRPIHTPNDSYLQSTPAKNESYPNEQSKNIISILSSNPNTEACVTPIKNKSFPLRTQLDKWNAGDAHRSRERGAHSYSNTASGSSHLNRDMNVISPSTTTTDHRVFIPTISPILPNRSNYYYAHKASSINNNCG
jgi:hypothetical protein